MDEKNKQITMDKTPLTAKRTNILEGYLSLKVEGCFAPMVKRVKKMHTRGQSRV